MFRSLPLEASCLPYMTFTCLWLRLLSLIMLFSFFFSFRRGTATTRRRTRLNADAGARIVPRRNRKTTETTTTRERHRRNVTTGGRRGRVTRRRRRGEEHVPRARNEKCRHFLSDVLCVCDDAFPNGVTKSAAKRREKMSTFQNTRRTPPLSSILMLS